MSREVRNEGIAQGRRLMSHWWNDLKKSRMLGENQITNAEMCICSGRSTDDKHLMQIKAPVTMRGNTKSASAKHIKVSMSRHERGYWTVHGVQAPLATAFENPDGRRLS